MDDDRNQSVVALFRRATAVTAAAGAGAGVALAVNDLVPVALIGAAVLSGLAAGVAWGVARTGRWLATARPAWALGCGIAWAGAAQADLWLLLELAHDAPGLAALGVPGRAALAAVIALLGILVLGWAVGFRVDPAPDFQYERERGYYDPDPKRPAARPANPSSDRTGWHSDHRP